MDTLRQDLRYALRRLAKAPAFTSIVVLTLGLGIGANTAIFSLLDQILLRTLPVEKPEELVILDGPGAFQGRTMNDRTFSYPMYRELRDKNEVFSGVLGRSPVSVAVTWRRQTDRVEADMVSGNYFDVLGVRPAVGRLLTPDDDRTAGAHPLAVLSYGFWTRRFGSDPAVVGQVVHVNDHAFTVLGVTPPGFHGIEVGRAPDLMVPMTMKAVMTPTWDDLENRKSRWLNVMARLKPGLEPAQALAGLNVLYRQINERDLAEHEAPSERFRTRFLEKKLVSFPGGRGLSQLRQQASTPLVVLMAMVGLVLLIACANVANLLLARAASRQKEVAIRLALGAGRGRLVLQLVVESLVLAFLGGIVGLIVSAWTTEALLQALPLENAARSLSARPDLRVGLFAFGMSLLTGLLFGLAPALQVSRPSVAGTLKDESTSVVGGATNARFRRVLVVAQVALSLLLLVGAGLFARSLHNLRSLDPGFASDHLVAFSLDPTLSGYDQARTQTLFRQLQGDLSTLPGARSASMAVVGLMTGNAARATVKVDGYERKEDEDMTPELNWVGPGFFSTLGVRLLAGREFDETDVAGGPRVAVVNETFAKYFFKDGNPVGRRFGLGRDKQTGIEIVGVVRDGQSVGLRAEPTRRFYTPVAQETALDQMTFYVRSEGPEAALIAGVRQLVLRADARLPVFDMKTMRLQVEESLFVERTVSTLSACFGLLATVLAALGLYGVMSYAVALRTREIGIRMALGAAQSSVLLLVLQEVALLAGLGIAIGLPSAFGLGRLVQSQLFGISPADPLTLGGATLLLAAVAALAGLVPARRATRVDPLLALRYE